MAQPARILTALLALAWLGAGPAMAQQATGDAGGSDTGGSDTGGGTSLANGSASSGTGTASGPQDSAQFDSTMPRLAAPISGVSPHTGINGEMAGLRDLLLGGQGAVPADQPGTSRAWNITAGIGGETSWTDTPGYAGGYGGGTATGSDIVFALTPRLGLSHPDGPVSINAFYSPRAEFYLHNSANNQVQQNFDGDAQAEILPGWLYTNLRGAAAQNALFGGTAVGQNQNLAPQNRQNTYSFSISPFLAHGFGDLGTLQAGYGYVYSAVDAPDQTQLVNLGPLYPGGPDAFYPFTISGSSVLRTQRGFLTYLTGDALARLRTQTSVDANYYKGTGALEGARRVNAQVQGSYAITRALALVVQGGYENLDYPRIGFGYRGPTGAGGVTLRPNADSKVTLQYRYIDGESGLYARGTWQATARIRVFGGYSKGIGSDLQDDQTALLSEDADARGVRGSVLTSGPLLSDAGFGADQQVRRTQRLDLSASYLLARDTFTLAVLREQSQPVGTPLAGGPVALPADSITTSAGWQRELREDLSVGLNGGYTAAASRVQGVRDADNISLTASLNKSFPHRLTLSLRYVGRYALGHGDGYNSDTQNSITLAVNKDF